MLRTLAFLTAAVVGTASAAPAQFAERSVDVHGKTYRYQVFIPADVKKQPAVVLFLHAVAEGAPGFPRGGCDPAGTG